MPSRHVKNQRNLSEAQHLDRAKTYQAEGKTQSQIIELKNILQSNPKHAEAHWLLAIAGLTPVGDEGCALVGQLAGCVGFITPEDGIGQLDVSFNITTKNTNVPEPGMLALLGLGLAGLGFSQARRRK